MPGGESQIVSRSRVRDHGEVFTAPREVKAMCDLVKDETERIDSRFLEPACGTGNFLAEILSRKLAVVRRLYGGAARHADFEQGSVASVMSLYGVEILADNARACRERLFKLWNAAYEAGVGADATDRCRQTVRFVLGRNILCGNALSLLQVDESGKDIPGRPIIFSEWAFKGALVKRRDFRLDVLLSGEAPVFDLFDDVPEGNWRYDEATKAFVPKPVREFTFMPYLEVQDAEST